MKTMSLEKQTISEIKSTLENSIGQHITITEKNKQGKTIHQYSGKILSAYNSVFIIKINIKNNILNKSFSYVDFITIDFVFEIE